jgi:hypothetical protein
LRNTGLSLVIRGPNRRLGDLAPRVWLGEFSNNRLLV